MVTVEASIVMAFVLPLLLVWWWWGAPQRRLKHISEIPTESILFGNIGELVERGVVDCQRQWARVYGPICRYRIGRLPIILISDIALIKEIMMNTTIFDMRPLAGSCQQLSPSLLFAEGARWKTLRHALNPSFAHYQIAQFAPLFDRCVNNVIGQLHQIADTDHAVDLAHLFKLMALDVIGSAAFAQKFDTVNDITTPVTIAAAAILDTQRQSISRNTMLLPSIIRFPRALYTRFPSIVKVMSHVNLLDDWVYGIVKERSSPSAPLPPKDILTLMMETRDKVTQEPMFDRRDLAGNARTFIIAGHETTGTTIAIALYHIDRNPDVKRILLEEIDRLAAEGDLSGDPVESKRYTYLDWVIKESTRMLTVTPIVTRGSSTDAVLGDGALRIPARIAITIPIHIFHHSREFWGDPETFRPERFDPDTEEYRLRNPNCFMPFGAGPRMCIGFRFAQEEMKQALIKVLHQFDLSVDEGKTDEPLRTKFLATVEVIGGIHFRVRRRLQPTTI